MDNSRLESALRNAHTAGDVSAAKALANELKRVRAAAAPVQHAAPQASPNAVLPGISAAMQQRSGSTSPESLRVEPLSSQELVENNIRKNIPVFDGDVSSLSEIGEAPELGEFSMKGFKAALGANLINSDFEQAQSLAAIYPDAKFSRDEGLNLIATMPSGGSFFLNKPGFSGQDVAKFATRALAFTPAGRGVAGVALPTLGKAAGQSALTETALQGAEATVGGDFNPESVAIAAAAAPLGQVIGEKVIAPAIKGATELTKTSLSGGNKARTNIQAAIDDFAEFGDVPTLGTASGGQVRQGLQNLSSRVLGGSPIRNAMAKTSGKIQKRLADIADDISPVTGELEAGRVIQRGISGPGGFVDRFTGKSGVLWNKFDGLIDDAAEVAVGNTAKQLDDLVSTTNVGQILNNPLLKKVQGVVAESGGNIPYKDLRSLRTMIGRRLGSNELISDIPRAELKQLYGAISRDIEELATGVGGDAIKSWKRANNFTRAGHSRIDGFVERIAGKADLDKVFNAVAKGGEGVQAINAIKRSLNPDEWETVASNVIRRLGKVTAGQQDDLGQSFSVNKLLTDWNKLGRAKDVMFSGSEKLNSYRSSLDRVASAANKFKEASTEMANPSGSGQFLANVGAVTAAGGALGTGNLGTFATILLGISSNRAIAGQLMANPKFVRWLAQGTTTKSWPAHMARLSTVAGATGNSEEIVTFLEDLQQMSLQTSQTSSSQ